MRYFISLLSIFALVLLVLLLIIKGLSGDDGNPNRPTLADFTRTDVAMRLTIDGEINSDLEHQGIRITVDRTESKVEILQGYRQVVIASQSFASNEEAYANFLRALDLLGYTKGNDSDALKDERGYCAQDIRYVFEIRDGGRQVQRFWKTTCKQGSFGGDVARVVDLFERQIPDYHTYIKDVEL